MAGNDELMTTRQAAEALGVAVRTVQLWVEAGVLPAWRTAGGHRRISRSAVEGLMAERARVIARPPEAVGTDVDGLRPLKLLIVEDDPVQSQLFALMVNKWDFPVQLTTAADGFEGLLRIGQMRPDMLITDLNMPGMDGFQMVRALKVKGSGFEDLVVIAVSSFSNDEIFARGGLPEGVLVFHKPLDFEQIEALARLQAQRISR